MPENSEVIDSHIQALALALVTMDGEDIPVLGDMLNRLTEIEKYSNNSSSTRFNLLVQSLGAYLEKVVLREVDDLKPFEQGLEHLQAFFHCMTNDVDYENDLTQVFSDLGATEHDASLMTDCVVPAEQPCADLEAEEPAGSDPVTETEVFGAPDPDLDDEDRDIISGFVVESLEGLETIEVSLIDLEQNPEDKENINAIFRAFHTIKGVSSFLGFMRINRLAHRSENLLDKIRSDELTIDAQITDVILDSVDLLKQLIQGVQNALDSGTPLDIGLDIAPLTARIDAVQENSPPGHQPIGEIMISQGAVSSHDVQAALTTQQELTGKKLGQILVEQGASSARQVAEALNEQKKNTGKKRELQVKVDTQKLDNLVDLTGELVIAQSMLRQHPYITAAANQQLVNTLGQLNQITSGLQTMTMSLRMVPIKNTFQKMLRLVRDLSKNCGKKVKLVMSGEDTEIDRNVVDELYEPMVHMIRNSVDHGLELPQERQAAGKDPVGRIHLKAYHRGGNIIVEIGDDGRGLDKKRILEKARANDIITDESKLSETEICNLIFQPGFSTARTVNDISGRGVGMDVVKKGIEKLRGRVDIDSVPGSGSTFIISLPLTLAIIEGMLVRVGDEKYVIPALSIVESFRPTRDQFSTVAGKGEMIMSRGRLIPLVRLSRIFSTRADIENPWEGLVVRVEYDGNQMCLLLDELLGKEEVVIKSMGEIMKAVKGIAGGAILGDGKVGLILDMAGIWQLAMNPETTSTDPKGKAGKAE